MNVRPAKTVALLLQVGTARAVVRVYITRRRSGGLAAGVGRGERGHMPFTSERYRVTAARRRGMAWGE
jgi:hypothetical protein